MNKRKIKLLVGAALLCLIGYLSVKVFIFYPEKSALVYPNKFQKKENIRSNFKSAEFCKACHKKIYDDWKKSYMSKSYSAGNSSIALHTISLGLRGVEQIERRWCIQCHSPLALTTPEDLKASDPIAQEGVTCTVCHSIVKTHPGIHPSNFKMDPLGGMNGPFDDSLSPMHPTRRNKLFLNKNSKLCGSCHWSIYPGSKLPIDATYPEWLEYRKIAVKKGKAPKSCQECHMPVYKGKASELNNVPKRKLASHVFPGGRDEKLVKESADFTYELKKEKSGAVLKVMVKNLTGHNLPTGNASWPQVSLAVNFLQGNESKEIAVFKYHTSYLLKDGSETYDTTIGYEMGPDATLKPFETRIETVKISEEVCRLLESNPRQFAIEIKLLFCYNRLLDATAPFLEEGNIAYTLLLHIYQWLMLEETNIKNIVDVLIDRDTYARLEKIGDLGTVNPILIKKKIIKK